MRTSQSRNHSFHDCVWLVLLTSGFLLILGFVGCGGSSPSAPATPQAGPQLYFSPVVGGANSGSSSPVPTTYSFDDTATPSPTFTQTTYNPETQPGPQLLNAGVFTIGQRGLRSLSISTTYVFGGGTYVPTTPTTSGGSFAVELAGQAGGFAQLTGQPVAPLVAATTCPNFSSPQAYQFVTIPQPLLPPGLPATTTGIWDPTTQAAYGSVSISSTSSTVNFQNIQQFTLPPVGGSGTPVQSSTSSLAGICAPAYFGNTTLVPGTTTIGNPGTGGSTGSTVTPQATIGIGPSGLLLEDNGGGNALGAGTGVVGLPRPSSPLSTSGINGVVGAQYLGFIYSGGTYVNTNPFISGWTSHLASFGFPSAPACPSFALDASTSIYGGDFPQSNGQDNPSASSNGFGNCDFAIDLGAQDSANNGLYPHATVWVGATYVANPTQAIYKFPAVAIAGQLNGKYAIFLIGADSAQPWAIYLLQSN